MHSFVSKRIQKEELGPGLGQLLIHLLYLTWWKPVFMKVALGPLSWRVEWRYLLLSELTAPPRSSKLRGLQAQ